MKLNEYLVAIRPNPLHDEIYDLVRFASKTYEAMRSSEGLSNNDGEHWDMDSISSFESNGVVTEWEYDWNYGGHNEGTAFIPIDAILGSEEDRIAFIKSVVQNELDEIKEEKLEHEKQEEVKRFSKYMKLKEEFEVAREEFE